MSEETETINMLWMLGCTACVFLMQAGFCCLEAGMVRARNSINVAVKNVVDLCLSTLVFWLLGFGLLFGASVSGLFGSTNFVFSSSSAQDLVFFLFQAAFCGTVVTIVAGAVAERLRFIGYVFCSVVLAGLIYPVAAHWAWGGLFSGRSVGWLEQLGYVDFAGAGVVHATGGGMALAAVLILGPRKGRFEDSTEDFGGHNLPMSSLGVLLLWIGWFGFNGGSGLALSSDVPAILLNTLLGAAAGGCTGLFISLRLKGRAEVTACLNGVLAGLVSVTAGCHAISPVAAVLAATTGAGLAYAATQYLLRRRIDDVVGAIPVHAVAGVWGVLAVAIFGNADAWGTGLSRGDQLLVQAIGALAIVLWSFGAGYTVLRIVDSFSPLRVSPEAEAIGLNVAEHGAVSELSQLLRDMQAHRGGDFNRPVSVASNSEVGQIARQYNQVLSVVGRERAELVSANQELLKATNESMRSRRELETKVAELEAFTGCAVGRELRMIELKEEVNALAGELGEKSRYATDFLMDIPFENADGSPNHG